ncbi:MAG: hypothetical protein ACRCX8_12870 [Sarcina sp.]
MSENIIDVEEKIEIIEENVITPIDNNAIGDQVELPVDPTEPEKEPSDDELTATEIKEVKEFENEMEEILANAVPEVTATLEPEDGLNNAETGATVIGGYNPEAETGDSKLVEEIEEAAKPITAEVVQDTIVNAADMLSAKPEEYTFNQNEVLVETEDDKVEDVTTKIDNVSMIKSDGVTEGELKVTTEEGEKVSDFVSLESDMETIEKAVEQMVESIGEDSNPKPEEVEIKGDLAPEENNGSFEDINANAQVGEITIDNVQVINSEGADTIEIDATIPSVAETPLDNVETEEVIHINTVDEVEIEKQIEADVKAMIGTENEGTDLNLGIVDGNQVVEKGADGEVIVGDFTEVCIAVTAEANKDLDGESLKEFEVTSNNPDEHVVIDETKQIEANDGGPIAGEFGADDYADAFDSFINATDDDVVIPTEEM